MSETSDLVVSVVGTDSDINIETLEDAKVILSLFLEEVRSDEQIRSASSANIEVFIKRAIYSLNKETVVPNEAAQIDSILPYIDNQSGCALQRVNQLANQVDAALSIIENDGNWMSTLDMQDSEFVVLDLGTDS